MKLGRRSSDGRENLVAVMGPADQFGELSLFDPGPRTATAVVVTDARLARLPKQALQTWVQERPQIAIQLLHVIARRLRRTNTMLADLIFVDVPGRVAKQLLLLPSTRHWPTSRYAAGCASRARAWSSSIASAWPGAPANARPAQDHLRMCARTHM